MTECYLAGRTGKSSDGTGGEVRFVSTVGIRFVPSSPLIRTDATLFAPYTLHSANQLAPSPRHPASNFFNPGGDAGRKVAWRCNDE